MSGHVATNMVVETMSPTGLTLAENPTANVMQDQFCFGTQARMEEAKNLFRNADTTQFIIVTIPTVMAAAESARLADALRVEGVPVKLMVINQVCQSFCALIHQSACTALGYRLVTNSQQWAK